MTDAAAKIANDTAGMSLPLGDAEPRSVTILGSTGSIGGNTIDLLRRHPESFTVEALTAHSNIDLLASQARQIGAKLAVTADTSRYKDLKEALSGSNIRAAAGAEAVDEAAAAPPFVGPRVGDRPARACLERAPQMHRRNLGLTVQAFPEAVGACFGEQERFVAGDVLETRQIPS